MNKSQLQKRPQVGLRGQWVFPASEDWRTEGGIGGCHVPMRGSGLIDFTVHIDAPLTGEPRGSEGVADVIVRALEEGASARRDAVEFAAAMDEVGATFSANVTVGGPQLQVGAPAEAAATALTLVAELLQAPVFSESAVARMVANNLDDHAEISANSAQRARAELYASAFAPKSRQALPVGGIPSTVSSIDHDVVAGYWSSIIGPERIRVVSAGDVSRDEMQTLTSTSFGTWSAAPSNRVTVPEPLAAAPRIGLIDRPGAVQTAVAIGSPTVSREHPDYAALSVASYVLGVPINSRLSLRLREEKGYTYGVRSTIHPDIRGGLFAIATQVERDVTLPALEDLYAIVAAFRANGITPDEHANAVEGLLGKDPIEFQTPDRLMRQLADQEAHRLPRDWLSRHRQAIEASTPSSCDEAFETLVSSELSLVLVGDATLLEPTLSAAGWNVEVTA